MIKNNNKEDLEMNPMDDIDQFFGLDNRKSYHIIRMRK